MAGENWPPVLQGFYSDLLMVEGRAELSAQTYCFSCEEFILWLDERRIGLKEVTSQDLMHYLIWRREHGSSDLTVSKDISALRSFGTYLKRQGLWTENPAL